MWLAALEALDGAQRERRVEPAAVARQEPVVAQHPALALVAEEALRVGRRGERRQVCLDRPEARHRREPARRRADDVDAGAGELRGVRAPGVAAEEIAEDDVPGARDRRRERRVVGRELRVGGLGEDDVEGDHPRAGGGQPVDQLGHPGTAPGPAAVAVDAPGVDGADGDARVGRLPAAPAHELVGHHVLEWGQRPQQVESEDREGGAQADGQSGPRAAPRPAAGRPRGEERRHLQANCSSEFLSMADHTWTCRPTANSGCKPRTTVQRASLHPSPRRRREDCGEDLEEERREPVVETGAADRCPGVGISCRASGSAADAPVTLPGRR